MLSCVGLTYELNIANRYRLNSIHMRIRPRKGYEITKTLNTFSVYITDNRLNVSVYGSGECGSVGSSKLSMIK